MNKPVPRPPAQRYRSAADEAYSRSGFAVHVHTHSNKTHYSLIHHRGQLLLAEYADDLTEKSQARAHRELANRIQSTLQRWGARGILRTLPVLTTDRSLSRELDRAGYRVFEFAPSPAASSRASALASQWCARLYQHMVISTDASKRFGSKVVGHGWVAEFASGLEPVAGTASSYAPDVLTAELRSIRFALRYAIEKQDALPLRQTSVLIRSDSLHAVKLLTGRAQNLPTPSVEAKIELQKIRTQLHHCRAKFMWVRSHNGDRMNELADRLAMLARRNRECNVDPDTQQLFLAEITRELVA
ncbi:ribonuclease HI [Micrococcoides hystricis]|uniref:Ribonuclease HI n=1 Tax=Micrococcoides hystricis TaxID=1572761 RepID=A0ABV6PAK7_9MICC